MLRMVLLAAALGQAPIPNSAEDLVRTRAQPVLDRFHQAVIACKVVPPAKPMITIAQREGIIHFNQERNEVVLYPWSVMGKETHAAQAKMAARGRRGLNAEATYVDIFNDLLVAHELGHWIQSYDPAKSDAMRDGRGNHDRWRSEYNANQIMIAFWREHSTEGAAAAKVRLEDYLRGLESEANPLPPPAGETELHFFNSDTMAIIRADAYGWYQGRMGRLAYDESPRPHFCALVSQSLPPRR